jgi:Ni,Fe-hydrogenase III small subunit/NAD-dependent dihydropyrimidine dehydrogenase PreA subunit
MSIFWDRATHKIETVKDPLFENQNSFGKITVDQGKCSGCEQCKQSCIVGAIDYQDGTLTIEEKKCIYCRNCIRDCPDHALQMSHDYKMASLDHIGEELKKKIYAMFHRSLALRSVDTGSCNACMLELAAILNPFYDVSRFGISVVASPRHADGIIVTGPVTINMREALIKTYEAMAPPRLVIALGACGYDGGIYKQGYGSMEPLAEILPVDLLVPGCPPSPQAIIYGLLKLMDRL